MSIEATRPAGCSQENLRDVGNVFFIFLFLFLVLLQKNDSNNEFSEED